MNRRNFLTRSGLALGALIVGDEALEAVARLTHVRKTFPSAAVLKPIGEMRLYVRHDWQDIWVLHDTAPLHDTAQATVTFKRRIPDAYTEGRLVTVLHEATPSMTINAYVEAS